MVQGSMSCVKYLMFIFNFVFVVCGIILIVIGAVVQTKDVTYFLDSKFLTAPIILIVIGCAVFLLAFLGCCGAIKENTCMVTLFGTLLFAIVVVEIAGAVTAYVYKDQLSGFLKESMNSTISQMDKKDAQAVWNDLQTTLDCCGVDGPRDFLAQGKDIPPSCCEPEATTCTEITAKQNGCFEPMLNKIKDKMRLIGGVGIGIAIVELIGCIFAWCLSSAIKREYEGV